MKARYLLRFAYIGTYFRGAEKLWLKSTLHQPDPRSIQGVIEIGLHRLKSLNQPKLVLSSRTDAGVHALSTTGHVDLERFGSRIYDPAGITASLNSYFHRNSVSLLIQNTRRVPDNFHARYHAISRSYVYRFAILKKNVEIDFHNHNALYPMEEWRRCYYMRAPQFDIEKFKEAASYLPGLHDWSSFKKFETRPMNSKKHNRRTLHSVEVRPGRSVAVLEERRTQNLFDYWEVEFRGQGFVYNQIRRIIGVLKAVGEDRVPVEEIKVMLQVPSKHSWPTKAMCAPPHGLYLSNVEYNPKDMEFSEETGSTVKVGEPESDDDE